MKLVIRTLALLLVLSSTAVAEDWSTLQTATSPSNTSFENSLPAGQTSSQYAIANYERFISRGGTPPSGLAFPMNVTSSDTAGISIRNEATILAQCVSQQGATYGYLPPLGGFTSGAQVDPYVLRTTTLERTSCPPGVISGSYHVPISAFARSDTVGAISADVAGIQSSLSLLASVGALNGVAARVSAIEAVVGSIDTTSNLNALATRVAGAESQLAAIQSGVADLAAFVPEALGDIRRQADEGSAMAAAMTTVAPADGKANRIGFNTATYNGSTAVAVSYSRAAGDVDFNVGVAMAGENAMVKAGAGFSW